MTQEEKKAIIDKAVGSAVMAQVRDDVCARSALYGLSTVFDFIPKEMVTASASLAGGTGSANGSCGAYCAGLLAVGLQRNATIEEEVENPAVFEKCAGGFNEYRERFISEMGTIMCPKIHEKVYGRSFDLSDPKELEEYMSISDHREKCGQVVAVAVRIAAEMILDGMEDKEE